MAIPQGNCIGPNKHQTNNDFVSNKQTTVLGYAANRSATNTPVGLTPAKGATLWLRLRLPYHPRPQTGYSSAMSPLSSGLITSTNDTTRAIAQAIQEARRSVNSSNDPIATVIEELADVFAADNGDFKRDRFERACEPGANVRART
jgi:hypothetical protein